MGGCKNGWDLLYHHAKYGGDRASGAGCRRKSVTFFTGRPARSAAMPVLFLLNNPKIGFTPQGRHVAPIYVKFGTRERAKFHVYHGRNVGIQPPKLSIIRILAINLPLRGHSFSQFLRNSQIYTRL